MGDPGADFIRPRSFPSGVPSREAVDLATTRTEIAKKQLGEADEQRCEDAGGNLRALPNRREDIEC